MSSVLMLVVRVPGGPEGEAADTTVDAVNESLNDLVARGVIEDRDDDAWRWVRTATP